MTFAAMVEIYQEDAKHRVREGTRGTVNNNIDKWLLPFFGNLQMDDIDAVTTRKWQNECLKAVNPRTHNKYAATYLRTINSRLSAIFSNAVKYYNLRQNPCIPAGYMGKKKAGRVDFWTLDEFNQVIGYITNRAYRVAFLILYWTGIRSGECLALRPADILETKAVRIDKTYHRRDRADTAGPPKTENSFRGVICLIFFMTRCSSISRRCMT